MQIKNVQGCREGKIMCKNKVSNTKRRNQKFQCAHPWLSLMSLQNHTHKIRKQNQNIVKIISVLENMCQRKVSNHLNLSMVVSAAANFFCKSS